MIIRDFCELFVFTELINQQDVIALVYQLTCAAYFIIIVGFLKKSSRLMHELKIAWKLSRWNRLILDDQLLLQLNVLFICILQVVYYTVLFN